MTSKPRLLTGDTPTGRLHLGHLVGSLENRLELQEKYDSYFILANMHAFTTKAANPNEIYKSVLEVATDWLAVGLDPKKSTMFIQSDIPAIAELTFFLSMLIPANRVLRNPTLKDEIRDKKLGNSYPFGFLLYPVGQVADILAFRPELVPVGADQLPLIEMTREVAKRFNQMYCDVDSHTPDEKHCTKGGLFPIPQSMLGRANRLVGTGGPGPSGKLLKMSKSLNNAIYLSDSPDIIAKKIKSMYTDPKRLKATDPGSIENNPLWIFHEIFNHDHTWVKESSERYKKGAIGDVECKKRLIDILIDLIEPIYKKRKLLAEDPAEVIRILRNGAEKANNLAATTIKYAKEKMQQIY